MSTPNLLQRIQRIHILSSHLAEELLAGSYHSAFKGKGMEFEEVRAYIPGDEVRHIDWNVTARMQQPYIKLFREEREINIALLIDISPSTSYGNPQYNKREYITELAAVLAFSAAKNNDRVSAILFSDRVEKTIAPGRGIKHVMRIIDLAMRQAPKSTRSDLGPALAHFGKLAKKNTICFILSDFFFPPVENLTLHTAQRHDLIGMMAVDPTEITFPEPEAFTQLQDLETKEIILVDWNTASKQISAYEEYRKSHQAIFNKAGATMITLDTSQSYLPPLLTFFRLRARRR